jgi:serine/threonine protein kinase
MKRVAHMDVKSQNILLDDNLDTKLYDFGLCMLIDRDKSQVVTKKSFHLITLLEEKLKSDQLVDLIDMCSSSDIKAHKQEAIQMMKLAMWCLHIDCKQRPKMSEVIEILEGNMSAKTDIDHNFVVTNPASLIRCSWNCGLVSSTSSLRSVRPKVRD